MDVENPFSEMIEASVAMHEMFKSYCEAGFTEDQALKLIAYHMVAMGTGEDE